MPPCPLHIATIEERCDAPLRPYPCGSTVPHPTDATATASGSDRPRLHAHPLDASIPFRAGYMVTDRTVGPTYLESAGFRSPNIMISVHPWVPRRYPDCGLDIFHDASSRIARDGPCEASRLSFRGCYLTLSGRTRGYQSKTDLEDCHLPTSPMRTCSH